MYLRDFFKADVKQCDVNSDLKLKALQNWIQHILVSLLVTVVVFILCVARKPLETALLGHVTTPYKVQKGVLPLTVATLVSPSTLPHSLVIPPAAELYFVEV